MTTAVLWIALVSGSAPGAGLSSEDFDKYFAAVEKSRNQCGPTAVWYCLRRLGREVSYGEVTREVAIGKDGASLQSLLDLLHGYDVPARALRAEPLDVRLLPRPCILVIDRRHCVVLERIEPSGREATVFEPARREIVTLPIEELTRQCSGEVIVLADPGMSTSAFTAWVACSLAVFLSLCAGVIGVAHRVSCRVEKQPGTPLIKEDSRPSDDVILGSEQR